ncbi:SusC/RagA family TonB-linked outer membrane protein [Myroides odoratimimus]|uniref:SusC/RagA family TonB-linked outer membrane protein n=1 Tax=Myroides odoratimimus TaxID=76832 RepID=UPI002DBEFF79|nr:SusC/RagA family TonB-linked outer membrane protein [Myroides odoratimimus]MEC4028748.1 SusC/RagA family TonB-linked outer membrane protein [Myroides odoratimimus]
MKTQFLTNTSYGIVLLLTSLTFTCGYAVPKDSLFNVDYQKKTIHGIVKDHSTVLIGAIVQIKGTDVAISTDLQGKYSLQALVGDTLLVSYIGYKSKEITITNESFYNITLLQDQDMLDEVVINAGYYTVKDRERTGSIARVTAKDIELQPVINPLQAIQGRMAGVSITQNTGVPGGGFDIQIRGRNSLRKDGNTSVNTPLYVIDGVVIPTSNLANSPLATFILPMANTNILNSLNASDIESIEILKDADATAIYGSRGANGVVLITTKKNKSDKLSFILSSSTSFSKVASKMKLLNTEQFNKMREEAFRNDGITTFPDNALDMNGTWDRNRYTNWQKELIGGTALSNNIQLGISGGSETTHFSVSANQNTQTTVFPTDKGYKRNTFLVNVNHNSKDRRFQLNSSTNYSLQNNNLIAKDLTSSALTLSPNAPNLYTPDGSLNWKFDGDINPISSMHETYENDNSNLIFNLDLDYEVFKNTHLKLNTGYNRSNTEEKKLTPHTIHNPNKNYTSEQSKAENTFRDNKSYIIEPQINYLLDIDNLSINTLLGMTYQENQTNALHLIGYGFQTNEFISNITAAKIKGVSQSANLQYKYMAAFGRININYNNRYLLNLTARRDGSSRFGDNHKFGNFGAIGGAWNFSNEKFLKNLSWLSFGKLRASYGTSGNDNIGDYQYLDTYTLNSDIYDNITGLTPSRLYNPNFSWEKTNKLETALEVSLFNEKLQFDIAYYRNTSYSQLVGVPLPATTGFPSIQDNLPATVENKGWEFTISSQNIQTKNFNWTTNFNISFPKNTLLSFPNLESSTYANDYIIGKSTNVNRLYNFEGINPLTGTYIFTDYNGDNKISSAFDRQNIKERKVDYHGGIQNTINYKGFSVDFLFQFVKQTNYNHNYNLNTPGSISNQPVEILNNWSFNNVNSQYGYLTTGLDPIMNNSLNYFTNSNAVIGDASYIRLKNVSLSYLLKVPKIKIESLRLYFQGQNLWTITNYYGLDPESMAFSYLPPLKTYAFGVQLTF